MEIRPLKKTEVEAAAELAVKVMTPQFKNVGEPFLTKNQYAARLKEALDSMEFAATIKEKNKLVGFAHWYYSNNQAFVEDLVIDSKYGGAGHGKALANFILQTCKNDRVKNISLLLPHNSPGIKFAEKLGLKQVSVELKKSL